MAFRFGMCISDEFDKFRSTGANDSVLKLHSKPARINPPS